MATPGVSIVSKKQVPAATADGLQRRFISFEDGNELSGDMNEQPCTMVGRFSSIRHLLRQRVYERHHAHVPHRDHDFDITQSHVYNVIQPKISQVSRSLATPLNVSLPHCYFITC